MTRKELEKLFQPLEPINRRGLGEHMNGLLDTLELHFTKCAINMVDDLEFAPEQQARVLNHLWQAYVIAMGCHGHHVLGPKFVVGSMEIPTVSKFAESVRASGDDA